MTLLPEIASLNALPPEAFAAALTPLFEPAPVLTTALYADRPFASYASLIDRAESLASSLPFDAQLEVVNAHPRIGESAANLSALSAREQGASTSPDAEFAALNAAYEQRFGFRFIVFVNRRPREALVPILRARMQNSPDQELRIGLEEMFNIARDRLKTLSAG